MLVNETIVKLPTPAWDDVEAQIDARVLCDEADLRKAYELRYRVYCLERGFLDLRNYPERLETDKYDSDAVHVGLFDRDSDEIVATARLLRIDRRGAPILEHCIFAKGMSPTLDGSTAEISRLVVNRHYALRPSNPVAASLECDAQPKSWPVRPTRIVNPSLMLLLCRILYVESKARGINTWYAAMERGLHRLLARQLIQFDETGPAVDYFGPVVPYRAFIDELEQYVMATSHDMHSRFRRDVPCVDGSVLSRDL